MGNFLWILMAMGLVQSFQFGLVTGEVVASGKIPTSFKAAGLSAMGKCTKLSEILDRTPEMMDLKINNATMFRANCSSTMMDLEKLKEQGVLDICSTGNQTLLAMYERLMRMCSRALTAHELILARVKRDDATTAGGDSKSSATTTSVDLMLVFAIVAIVTWKIDRAFN